MLSNSYWLQGKADKSVTISIKNNNTITRIPTPHNQDIGVQIKQGSGEKSHI